MRSGVRLALDWGKARIGVAASDPEGILAHPVETVPAGPDAVRRIIALVAEYEPVEVVMGLPRNLAGAEGPAAQAIRAVAEDLAPQLGVPLRLVDERLTTVAASRQLSTAGRNTRRQRQVIDQAAAVALLDQALAHERSTGRPLGEVMLAHNQEGPDLHE